MIFVTVGTNEAPFDRLVHAVAALETEESIVIQRGASCVDVPGARTVEFIPFDELVELVRRARVVVTHAGVGSTIVALSNGKRPIVVPRLKSYGEAVDDHQLLFGRRFADAGLVTLVDAPDQLAEAIAGPRTVPPSIDRAPGPLVAEIREFIEARVTPARDRGALA
jgi:UDP-N-acetylglucosamine transferase subunit ALG13